MGFSYLGHGVSLHGCSSKAQPLLLTLNKGYLLTAIPPDLERGIAPLCPPVPTQPPLLGRVVTPPGHRPWPRVGVAPLGCSCAVAAWHSWPPPLTSDVGVAPLRPCSARPRSRPPWKRSVFIPVPKKGNAKECSNYRTIALISQASKVMLKILQARLQQYMNVNFQIFKLVLEKAEEPETKLPTSAGS